MTEARPVQFEPLIPHLNEIAESAVWSVREQALYFIDIFGFRIHRVAWPDGAHSNWPVHCEPGSLALADDGGVVVGLKDGLFRLDTGTGTLALLAAPPYDPATMRFNDGCCDAAGRFWTGTMDRTRSRYCAGLWVYDAGELRHGPNEVMVSNGLAFSPDGAWLYQADSGRNTVYRYPYDAVTGAPGPRAPWFATDPADGAPDGASVDRDGFYWLAMYGGGCLLRIAPDGQLDRRVELPVRDPTMVAFGGPDLDCLIVTTSRFGLSKWDMANVPNSGMVLIARDTGFTGLPAAMARLRSVDSDLRAVGSGG